MEQDAVAVILERKAISRRPGGAICINLGESDEDEIILSVWDGRARLSDVVPVAREVAERLAHATCDRMTAASTPVTCRKHCSACCKYLVPLSVPEAFRLIEDLQSMEPVRRDRTRYAFADAAMQVIQQGPPQLPAMNDGDETSATTTTEAVGRWYRKLNITCPFLEQDVCGNYGQRPIACQEHMVTTPAADCAGFDPLGGSAVVPPFSVLEVLRDFAADMEGREPEAVMMPIALAWARMNPRRAERTWPARDLFQRFADHIHKVLALYSTADSAVA